MEGLVPAPWRGSVRMLPGKGWSSKEWHLCRVQYSVRVKPAEIAEAVG